MKHFCKLHFTILLILAVLQSGCVKSPVDTATDASLGQVDALQQQIKKDCPTVNYDKQMDALRDSIKTQLATCEAKLGEAHQKNNTLLVIIIGIIAVIITACWNKLKGIFK